MSIIQHLKLNQVVLEQLRLNALKANNGDLLEIQGTIQLIRYDNERLIKLLIGV